MDEHKIPLEELFARVQSTDKGLNSKEAADRLDRFGPNILTIRKRIPIAIQFLKEFTNFFALLLIVGSALSFLAESLSPDQGYLYIGIALGGVVILNATFTFIQKYQTDKIMETFQKMLPSMVEVLRDGRRKHMPANELVPGDVIFLREGDKVPADGRLIEEHSLKIDLASITGESEPELRTLECTHENILESRNMVFSGTLVQTGNGKSIVYCTGMDTQIGSIASLTRETENVETPLHRELKYFIRIISIIAMMLGISFFAISFFIDNSAIGSLIFAIGIIVANVPEGLLPTVTLCLSIASKRMAKKNALIKNLESVETLGSTTVICTDKTGTITENRMAVNTIFIDLNEMTAYEPGIMGSRTMEPLLRTMILCSNSRFDESRRIFIGDPTEVAIRTFADTYLSASKIAKAEKRIHESPFDSKTKRMISTNIAGRKRTAYLKGAPEVVLDMCSLCMHEGSIRRMTPSCRKAIISSYSRLAARGERVLAYGLKETKTDKAQEKDFIFLGLSGLVDPPRPEIPDAIRKCQTAGIRVIMITGDHALTAESIARKAGMIPPKEQANCVHGLELAKLSDNELKEKLRQKNLIFARTNPLQKLRIVKALQSMGEIVTVTGDGVNDAPALKNADMGVAMGLIGTEVAREAADMVLMDDNFATIVTAIEEGRTIFSNIKKFVAYILTSNVPEILPFIAFVLFHIPLPLTVVLILSIDLGTDILPALALGVERPETDVMSQKPRSRKEKLLTWQLLFISYGIIGMLQAAAGFFSYFVVLYRGGWTWGTELAYTDPLYQTAITAFFASIVICQIADVLICRTRRQSIFSGGIFRNRAIMLGIATELVLLAIISYVPFVQPLFNSHPLSLFELSLSIPFALLILFGDELRKAYVRRENPFVLKYLNW